MVFQEFNLKHENVVALVSDSAQYMNVCFRLLQEIAMPDLIHIQCHAHKLDKIAKVFSDKLNRLNECVAKTKKLFQNTRKRNHNYLKHLRDTYSFTQAKEAQLFPMPVMTRWGSWRLSAVYIGEYIQDVTNYAKTIPKAESVKSVEYFQKLTENDIKIIKSEADFVEEYCTPVLKLLVEIETSKDPLSHLLYSKINEVRKIFSVVTKADDVKTVLYEKTKRSLTVLPSQKRRNLEDRIKSVSKKCDEIFTHHLSSDPAKSLFKAARTLFDPSKIITSCSNEVKVAEAKANLSLLKSIPFPSFKVWHELLVDSVKDAMKSNACKNDLVSIVLLGMRINHLEFATACLQVLQMPVSNVDCERGFSAYGNILTANRNRLLPANVEAMMCFYFGEGEGISKENFDSINESF